jgi:glycosyltransferase involved in cell wall biosynthesis
MRIFFDSQTFNEQKFGGISRYYTEVIRYLSKKEDVELIFPLVYTDNLHLKESNVKKNNWWFALSDLEFLPKKITQKLIKKGKRKNTKNTIKKLKKQNFDVFIPTYYYPDFLEHIGSKPFVLTVYDMIHEILPHYFTADLFTVKNKKILIEKADKIIAISKSTKKDILKIYPHIDETKIEVVYLSHSIKNEIAADVILPKDYLLFVGNRTIYKNFIFFLKSVAPLLIENPTLHIVCAGGNEFNNEEIQLIKELNLSNQIIQQNFKDYQLATYYKNARCFIFPSMYEGFGIPVLESMACGCPVVLANHSSFPEVAGDAGCYFELNNEDDLKNKIHELLNNSKYREEIVKKGFNQAQKFNWKKTADDCLEVYKKTINQ